jgi:hypothetical protein
MLPLPCRRHPRCDRLTDVAQRYCENEVRNLLTASAAEMTLDSFAFQWLVDLIRKLVSTNGNIDPTDVLKDALLSVGSSFDAPAILVSSEHVARAPSMTANDTDARNTLVTTTAALFASCFAPCTAGSEVIAACAILGLSWIRLIIEWPMADLSLPSSVYPDAPTIIRAHSFIEGLAAAACVPMSEIREATRREYVWQCYTVHGQHILDALHTFSQGTTRGTVESEVYGVDQVRHRIDAARKGAPLPAGMWPSAQARSQLRADDEHLLPFSSSRDGHVALDHHGVHPFYVALCDVTSEARRKRHIALAALATRKTTIRPPSAFTAATNSSQQRERRRFCNIYAPLCDAVPHSYALERVILGRIAVADGITGDIAAAEAQATQSGRVSRTATPTVRTCHRQRPHSSVHYRPLLTTATAGDLNPSPISCTLKSLTDETIVPHQVLTEIIRRRPSGADLLSMPSAVDAHSRPATASTQRRHRQSANVSPRKVEWPREMAADVPLASAARGSTMKPFVNRTVPRAMQVRVANARLRSSIVASGTM